MAKRILVGSTDQTIDVFVPSTASDAGQGLAALAYNTSGLTCYYRKGATGTATQLSLATQTVAGAHSDGGFVKIDDTNMKGLYRLDLSDAMVDTVGLLKIYLFGAANMAPVVVEVEVYAAVYQAKAWVQDDEGNTNDRYVVCWYKNGEPITSGITSPTLQVIKASDGSDLVASDTMTQIASTGLYKYDEASDRMVDGAAYIGKFSATIGGATRTWFQPLGRDSA